MLLELEEKTPEYYIVAVEQYEYHGFQMYDKAISREPWATIDAWCTQSFGNQGVWGGAAGQWKRMGPKYFFGTDKERTMFVLRWQ
jgi:hypothetical protein